MALWNLFRSVLGAWGDHKGYQYNSPLTAPVKNASTIVPDAAVQIAAVWACVDLLSRTMGSLPCEVFSVGPDGRREPDTRCNLHLLLGVSPNQYMTPYEFWQTMTMHWALRGNAYAFISRNSDGSAYSLNPLNPDQMNVKIGDDGALVYEYFTRDNQVVRYAPEQIMHWKCMGNGIIGLSKLEYMRASLSEAIEAQSNAEEIFRNNGKIAGILTAEGVINNKAKEAIQAQFQRMRSEGGIPVLPVNLRFQQLSLSPADTELLSTRKFAIEEISRWFGVPSQLIGVGDGKQDWESVQRYFYKSTILPMCIGAEQALMKRVACRSERETHIVKFRLGFLNRASDKERFEIYAQAVQNGLMTRNECRRNEEMPDMPGADELTAQTNLTPLKALGADDPTQTPQSLITTEPIKQ